MNDLSSYVVSKDFVWMPVDNTPVELITRVQDLCDALNLFY